MFKKLKTYQKIFIFSILVVATISCFDILSLHSGIFGTPSEYLVGDFGAEGIGWWGLFYQFNLVVLVLISASYFWFGRKDFSETISLFLSSFALWMYFGLADLLFFIFQGKFPPSSLHWLNNGYIGKLSSIMGFPGVTATSLYLCVGIGLIFVYFGIKFLYERF